MQQFKTQEEFDHFVLYYEGELALHGARAYENGELVAIKRVGSVNTHL